MHNLNELFKDKNFNEHIEAYLERLKGDCRRLHDIFISEPLQIYVSDEEMSDRLWQFSIETENDPHYVLYRRAQKILDKEGEIDTALDIHTYVEACKSLIHKYTQMNKLYRSLFIISKVYYERLGYEVSEIWDVIEEHKLFDSSQEMSIKRRIYTYISENKWIQSKPFEWVNK